MSFVSIGSPWVGDLIIVIVFIAIYPRAKI
jgi:hypothetical protein